MDFCCFKSKDWLSATQLTFKANGIIIYFYCLVSKKKNEGNHLNYGKNLKTKHWKMEGKTFNSFPFLLFVFGGTPHRLHSRMAL